MFVKCPSVSVNNTAAKPAKRRRVFATYCAFCRHRDRELARTAATPDDEESKEFESEVALDVMSKNI